MSVRVTMLAASGWAALAGAAAAQATPQAQSSGAQPRAPTPKVSADGAPDPIRSSDADGSDFSFEFSAEALTDYVFRGQDQTNRRPAGLIDASLDYKSAYFGVSASNIDYAPLGDRKTDAEVDAFGGYKDEAFGFTYDVGLIYYGYISQPGGEDYFEGYIRGSRAIGPFKAGLSFYFSPAYSRANGGGVYGEGNLSYDLTRSWTVSGAVGRGSSDYDYLNWNIGVSYALTRRVLLDLRYSDTDAHDRGRAYGDRVVASIKLRLP